MAKSSRTFDDVEVEAMKERAKEMKPARRSSRAAKPDGEADVLAKIAE
ncbi:MAG: hypothetical protein HY834_09555, partial [Devosia nanyangense]|nr:hypothetical protein [Devosia nanyangense]